MARQGTIPDDRVEIIPPGDNIAAPEHAETLRQLDTLERLLDRQFSIAGFRFGLDSLIGLVPVAGDTVGAGLSAWLIWKAHRLGAPGHVKARMLANAGFDYLLGLVPLVGDVGDAVFKANTRNVRLLRKHLEKQHRSRGPAGRAR